MEKDARIPASPEAPNEEWGDHAAPTPLGSEIQGHMKWGGGGCWRSLSHVAGAGWSPASFSSMPWLAGDLAPFSTATGDGKGPLRRACCVECTSNDQERIMLPRLAAWVGGTSDNQRRWAQSVFKLQGSPPEPQRTHSHRPEPCRHTPTPLDGRPRRRPLTKNTHAGDPRTRAA